MRIKIYSVFFIAILFLGLVSTAGCLISMSQRSPVNQPNSNQTTSGSPVQNDDTPKANSQSDPNLAENSEPSPEVAESKPAADAGESTIHQGTSGDLTVTELSSMLASGEKLILIDLNPPAEYKEGHIRGAIWGDYGSIRTAGAETYLTQLGVKKTDTIVLVCEIGNKSARAVPLVARDGYLKVYSLTDGNIGWLRAGFNLEK